MLREPFAVCENMKKELKIFLKENTLLLQSFFLISKGSPMNLLPSYFFNLDQFEHKKIFENVNYVWEVLPKIALYLKNIPLGKIEIDIPKEAYLVNPELVSIGRGTVVEPGAYIKGPCIIGKNCTIRHGAYIRGDFIAGDDCVIGHDSEIKNTIFLNKTHAAHFAYVGDSILGNNVNLGAGTKCANLKLDNSGIVVHIDGEQISTELRKFGAILGDNTQMGCNSVANPGTLCGQGVNWYPCTNYGGFIPSKHRVKPQIKISVSPYRSDE